MPESFTTALTARASRDGPTLAVEIEQVGTGTFWVEMPTGELAALLEAVLTLAGR